LYELVIQSFWSKSGFLKKGKYGVIMVNHKNTTININGN
jgi:hypothetical protein